MVEALLENMPPAPWIILFAPLAAAAVIMLFGLKSPKFATAAALGGILLSFFFTCWMFWFHAYETHGGFMPAVSGHPWIQIPGFTVEFGFLIDRLSLTMLMIVTGVASCVFLYSTAYMKGDASYPRFFASLSLFAFSMIGIVLSNNFFMLFVFWELVAVSSYLLIGFWFEKPSAADAGNKAFIVNRLADFGMVLGIFLVWMMSGAAGSERTFDFGELSRRIPELAHSGAISHGLLTLGALLVFCGLAGKSAQFPLYIWLPDAMEGPTPVSALIHAATMVAAGIYMVARSFFLIADSHQALTFIATLGAVTALLAGLLALVQNDIKKILAYSTVSQLGYMAAALGLGSANVAMFHLTTHAFFKALLFLGAGAMIHALHTQDIWQMGGLMKKMPVTAVTFVIGTLALCGVPPLSGFFSKDEILHLAMEHNQFVFGVLLFGAALTAFYMTRALWIAVLGADRATKAHKGKKGHDDHHHTDGHDAPWTMALPLVILAILSVAGGFMGIPDFLSGHHGEHSLNMTVAALSVGAAFLGIGLGTLVYAKKGLAKDPLPGMFGGAYDFVEKKYYLDEFFAALANIFQGALANIFFWFDSNVVIRKGVNGAASLTAGFGSLLRRAQTGAVQTYAMVFGFGIAAIVYFILMRG
jgi:NADH-quinone oxidoreductase subunit L